MPFKGEVEEVKLKSPDPEAAYVRFVKKLYPQLDPGVVPSMCRSVEAVERDLVREVDAAMLAKDYSRVGAIVNELVVLARVRTEVCARVVPFLVERR